MTKTDSDARTVHLVIFFVGGITFLLAAGIIALAVMDKNPPEGVLTLCGTGLGVLGTMLTTTRSTRREETQSVEVVNTEANPANVAVTNDENAG